MHSTRKFLAALIGLVMVMATSLVTPVTAQTPSTTKPEEVAEPAESGKFEPFETPASERSVRAEQVAQPASGDIEPLEVPPTVDMEEYSAAEPVEYDLNLDNAVAPATSERSTTDRETRFGETPFGIEIPARDRVDRTRSDVDQSVKLEVLDSGRGEVLSNLGTAFTLEVKGYGGRSSALPKQDDERLSRGAAGASSPAEVDLGEGSGWEITLDRSAYADVLSREQLDRLTITVHDQCDKAMVCAINRDLPSRIDYTRDLLIVELGNEVLQAVGGPDRRATVGSTVSTAGGRAFRAVLPNMSAFAAQSADVFFSVSTAANGGQNDYSATELASLATWQVGLSTGHAETSYSVPITQAVGPTPEVTFSYSSGSVDGMTPDKNNQGGNIGLGWSMSLPVITRATRVCATKQAGQPGWTGIDGNGRWASNLCFAEGENQNQAFTLTMNGVGGRLVPYGSAGVTHPTVAGATYQRFVTEKMNGLRIWLVTDPSIVGTTTSNGGSYGQWWEVTTSDGTLHVFGRDFIFGPDTNPAGTTAPLSVNRSVEMTRRTNSTQVVPLGKSGGAFCELDRGMCDTVIAWHLDQVVDSNGNMSTHQYWTEINKYAQDVWLYPSGPFSQKDIAYERYVNPAHIDYGQSYTASSVLVAPNTPSAAINSYRVTFDYSSRTVTGLPSNAAADWPDTPVDQLCASSCTNKTPAMFTNMHLTTVTVKAGSQLVSSDTLHKSWPDPGDGSNEKLWLHRIQHHGVALHSPPIMFTKTMLQNRVNAPTGVPGMNMPRIGTIKTELGGQVTFNYGQPGGRQPSGAVASSHDCYSGAGDPNGYVRTGCYFFAKYHSNDTGTAAVLFNKWVVTSLTENSGIIWLTEAVTKTFTYHNEPQWAYQEQWGFTKTDKNPAISAARKHCEYGYGCNLWSDYRGHSEVTVTDGDGVQVRHYFHTGMREDRTWTSDIDPLWSGARAAANASLLESNTAKNGAWLNHAWQSGTTLGTRTLLPAGDFLVRFDDVQHNWTPVTSATAWPSAYFKASTYRVTELRDPTNPSYQRRSEVREHYDHFGRLYRVEDRGLTHTTGGGATAGDEVTTCHSYPLADATAAAGSWIVGVPYKTAVLDELNTSCAITVSFPGSGNWIAGSVTRFDGSNINGALPSRGNATSTFAFEKQGLALVNWPGGTFTYNASGQVLTSTERHTNALTTTAYDTYGFVASIDGPIAGTGDETSFLTNERWGVQTEITTKNAQEHGNATLVTSLTYDGLGRLETVMLPGDTVASTKFTYVLSNAAATPSHIKTEVLRDAGAASHEYLATYSVVDGFGRQVQTQTFDTVTNKYVVASNYFGNVGQQRRYDNPVSVSNLSSPGGIYTPLAFVNGHVTTTLNPDLGKVTTNLYDVSAVLKSTSYVKTLGLVTTSVDPMGRVSTSETDIRGNVIQTVVPAHSGTATTNLVYNARNQVTSIDGPGANDTITYSYGSDWSTHLLSLDDPDLGSVGYGYHESGRLEEQTDGNGNNLWIGYSSASQPVELRKDSSSGGLVAEWAYDNTGRNTTSTNYNLTPSGTSQGVVVTSASYEPTRGQVDSTTWSIPGLVAPQSISRTFDGGGRTDTVTYPDGSVSDIDYDLMGRQGTLTHDGMVLGSGAVFNARGQLSSFNSGNYAQTGDANASIGLSYIAWSGLLRSKTADSATGAGNENILDYTYAWDLNANLNSVIDESGGGAAQTQCYFYDAADQLTNGYTTAGTCASGAHDTGSDPYEVTYTYSANGNIATAYGDGTVNSSYAYGSKPHAVTSAGVNSYAYNTGGNQTSRTIDGQTSTLAYDIQNRLIGISGAGADMDALYDAGGNRVKRTLDGEVTYYLGDGYEFQPAATNPLASSAGGTTTTTAPATTTTTAPATTTTTVPSSTTTTVGGTKTVTVRATSWWNTAEFELEVSGVATDGNRVVSTSGGTYSLYTFQVPSGTTINDLKVVFDNDPAASIGVSYVEIDGEQYHTWLTTVAKLGVYNEGCANVTYVAATALSCAGYFDFSGVVPTGTTTTTAGGTTTTTAPATTTTTAPASTTTTVPSSTTTTVGGTKTVTVRATAWWNTPEFELHVSGVATDGRRAVTTSGGTYSLYTFQVPAGTSINDLRIDFDHSPAADIGVDYIEIDGEQYHMWLGTVAKLGNYNEGCANVTYAAVTSLSCAGYFDFSGVVPTGTTTTTAGGATTTTALATTTTVLATTTTTVGGTTTTTTPGGGSGGGGPVSVVRVHHSFNGQAIGTTINGEFVLSVSDHLGSASVNREAGGETSVQQYTPFGAVRGATGELLSDWTFTGQTDDPGTGLVDFNARHYDPQLGRFVMVDTVLDGLNRYTYVGNNPLNATDPTGHETCKQVDNSKWVCFDAYEESLIGEDAYSCPYKNCGTGLNLPQTDPACQRYGELCDAQPGTSGKGLEHEVAAIEQMEALSAAEFYEIASDHRAIFDLGLEFLDWSNDGCSNSPDGVPGASFLGACAQHDFSYRNRKAYADANGDSLLSKDARRAADDRLRDNLEVVCGDGCDVVASVYWAAVNGYGDGLGNPLPWNGIIPGSIDFCLPVRCYGTDWID